VIFLISGGGSAMIEWPIALDITLEDLRHANHLLVNCGASINEINAVRRAFSAVKGGRLAARAPNARQVNLIISDVNAGDEANVASGPTLLPLDSPDPKVVISQYHLVESLPYSVLSAIQKYSREPIAALSSETHVLLSNDSAVEAAARKASELGFKTEILSDICEQPIERGCDLLLERVSQIDDTHSEPVCLLSGGEFACPVRGDGKGGRNLETVLRCVIGFRRLQTNNHVIVLSVGTDGIDGNSPAAGAIGDETSCARALAEGLDADDYLARSDSFTFFDSLGDAIITGPTGTNVRDLRVILSNNLGSLLG
jgi:hydroxypyruvate reductase